MTEIELAYLDSVAERLKENSRRDGECLTWTGAVSGQDYGYISYWYKATRVHRVAWIVANKQEIPKGMQVCHKCDVRLCIEPSHLFLGTDADNKRDARTKLLARRRR